MSRKILPSPPVPSPQRGAGRPRSQEASDAILDAAADLLVQLGYAGLSIERVAAEARVAKTTIYRRWPTKLDLCLALLPRVLQALPIVEHGDARGDLRDFFLTVFAVATTEPGRIIPPLIAEAVHNAELRESFQQGYLRPRRERAILMAEHMIERGEIAAETDPSLFYDMLGGYIWFRRLVIGVPITAAEADAAVSALLDGTRKRRGPSENGSRKT